MKKSKLFIVVVILGATSLLVYNGCKKEEKPPVETCYDGIQNQAETGVDCGGPCPACYSVLCNGKGDTTYMPLVLNNQWTYKLSGGPTWDRVVTADSMVTFGSNTYFRLKAYESPTGNSYTYFRADANSNIYEYKVAEGQEYLAVPNNPTAGQVAAVYSGTGTVAQLKVVNASVQVATSACTYNGCVQMGEYDGGNALISSYYYKKGIGLVRVSYINFTDLKAVNLQ